jgi:hypothetical protein
MGASHPPFAQGWAERPRSPYTPPPAPSPFPFCWGPQGPLLLLALLEAPMLMVMLWAFLM